MPKELRPLFPREQSAAEKLGNRLRLARLRRRIALDDLALRAGITRKTLSKLEHGDASVSLAVLLRILAILGLLPELNAVANDDELGKRLQDVRLKRPRRRPNPDEKNG